MKTEHEYLNNHNLGYPDSNKFRDMVEERAFWKFKQRGFSPGNDLKDWFEAEREVSNQYQYWIYG